MKNEKPQARRKPKRRFVEKKRAVANSDSPTTKADETANILGRASGANAPARRVPAKWRWHHRMLLALQQRLLLERGDSLHAAAELLEPHSMDEADSATDEFDHDLAWTQLSAEQNALYEVNDALERILGGRYGVCEETGKKIPAARLRAIPWTRFTYAVKERLEKNGTVPRAGLNKAAGVRGQGQMRFAPEEETEEDGETPSALANDETLAHVFSPPGRRVPLPKILRRSTNAPKRKHDANEMS